jgi:hypothetical protein
MQLAPPQSRFILPRALSRRHQTYKKVADLARRHRLRYQLALARGLRRVATQRIGTRARRNLARRACGDYANKTASFAVISSLELRPASALERHAERPTADDALCSNTAVNVVAQLRRSVSSVPLRAPGCAHAQLVKTHRRLGIENMVDIELRIQN